MAGILDKKSRILDFVITENGRSQMQSGDIRYKYATLSDKSIVYTEDHEKSRINKNNISNAEFDYIPIEVSTKVNDLLNPEFDIKSYFLNENSELLNINQSLSFDDKVSEYLENFSLGEKLKNLKYLTTKSFINRDTTINFIDNGFLNNNITFNNVIEYDTIKEKELSSSNKRSIALDKRFSHKTNFMLMPPTNTQGVELYSRSQFKNIEDLDEENSTGFLLTSYKSLETTDIFERNEEILSIIKSLESNSQIHKKVYEIEKVSDFNGLIFEMHEKDNEKQSYQKLHFIKIGNFYDKTKYKMKKVYLVGKIINTKNNSEELDVLFNFNNGQVNLNNNNNTFALSAYFSFLCMFTIVIE